MVALDAATIPLAATASAAAAIACGQVLTQSVTLDADGGPCPTDGIVVGADDVAVDLGGHTVSAGPGIGRQGVWSKNHTGVVVKNGTVTGFEIGVLIGRGRASSSALGRRATSCRATPASATGATGSPSASRAGSRPLVGSDCIH